MLAYRASATTASGKARHMCSVRAGAHDKCTDPTRTVVSLGVYGRNEMLARVKMSRTVSAAAIDGYSRHRLYRRMGLAAAEEGGEAGLEWEWESALELELELELVVGVVGDASADEVAVAECDTDALSVARLKKIDASRGCSAFFPSRMP